MACAAHSYERRSPTQRADRTSQQQPSFSAPARGAGRTRNNSPRCPQATGPGELEHAPTGHATPRAGAAQDAATTEHLVTTGAPLEARHQPITPSEEHSTQAEEYGNQTCMNTTDHPLKHKAPGPDAAGHCKLAMTL